MIHHIVNRIAGSLLIAMVLAGCLSPVILTPTAVPVTVEPIWEPTRALLPSEAIPLKIVDGSQGSVISPVHGQLLVRACEKEAYDNCPGSYGCDLGYIDLVNEHFVRMHHISEEVPFCGSRETDLIWAPDGTQFLYSRGWVMGRTYFTAFSADGNQKHHIGAFLWSHAFWTPDGRYLVAKTREGSSSQSAIEYTVFNAISWGVVCAVGSGDGMIGIDVGGQCTVLLRDGRALFLKGWSNKGLKVDIAICSDQTNCPASNELKSIRDDYDQSFSSDRYHAQIENYWLRVFDSETNVTRTYEIPSYRIASIAWSPK